MDQHPAIRRRPRHVAPRQPNAPARQTFSEPSVLIITHDLDFLQPVVPEGTDVWRWRDGGGEATDESRDFGGDPEDPQTYDWIAGMQDVTAIVSMRTPDLNAGVSAALQSSNPDAAVLVIGDRDLPERAGPLARLIDWRRALCSRLEEELHRLETMKRVHALRSFAEGAEVVPILMHHDPDPDALASALAVRVLLRETPQATPVVTLDVMTRPENRRMADLLDLQVTQVTAAELATFERIICTDMQPRMFKEDPKPRLAVIDHHPSESGYEAEYVDIRPRYGATATILTEYLRADDERRINESLAAALVYAIKTDTDALSRGVTGADVSAYSFLMDRADTELLRRIERPAHSEHTTRAYGSALAGVVTHEELAVAYLGEISVDDAHILADVADFCLAMEDPTWAAAAAIVEGRLVVTLRHLGGEPGAGQLAKALAEGGGTGGGHATMARAVLYLNDEWGPLKDAPLDVARKMLLNMLGDYVGRIR